MNFDTELNQNELQKAFLHKVNKVEPGVRHSLASEPFDLYIEFGSQELWINLQQARNLDEVGTILPDWCRCKGMSKSVRRNHIKSGRKKLVGSIDGWMKQWKLTAPWCSVAAYFTLQVWSENSTQHYREHLFHPATYKPMKRLQPPPGLPCYNVEDGREFYVKRLRHDLKKGLLNAFPASALATVSRCNAFIDHIVSQTVDKYCKPAESLQPLTPSTKRRQLEKHLEWAVRVHIKGEKQADITRELQQEDRKRSVTAPAISQAIKNLLKDLDLIS